jgi:hypothetical protein
MGYYVDKKQTLNVNKSLNDLSEEELEQKQKDIESKYAHFIQFKDDAVDKRLEEYQTEKKESRNGKK